MHGRSHLVRIVGTLFVLGALSGGIYQGVASTGGSSPPPTGTANLWVDGNGGTCTRQSTAGAYVDAAACSSLPAAYTAANAGDLVLVKCGTYGQQVFTTNKTSGANVVFQAETTQCATLGSVQFTDGGDRSTVQNFVISDGFYAVLNDNNSRSSSFVTINNNIIDPGVEARHQVILVKSAQDWVISNNTIGPVCCGTGTDSPEGIRIVPQSNNVTISNNLIQYVSRDCGYWPSSGWGSCPGTTCNPACHTDGIHIWGLTNGHIIGNRIYADDCQGIYIEHPGNETLGPIDVIDNAVGPLAESCGSAGIKIHADNATVQGTWTIAFNSGAEALEIGSFSGCSPCTFNLIGNYMPLFTLDSGGNDAGCNPPNVAVNYSYNVWTFVNGGTNTACGSHDIYTGAGGSFVNSTGAPNLGVDLHTTGSVSADNYVPTGICTPVAPADFDGQVRPIGAACDAGADER